LYKANDVQSLFKRLLENYSSKHITADLLRER
jgi:hypothetical protein